MNRKELLGMMIASIISVWVVDYFFFSKKPAEPAPLQSGQSFVAQPVVEQSKPLNLEIDFLDERYAQEPVRTEVETQHARLLFSTLGASLERFEYKRTDDGSQRDLTTIFPVAATEREKRCFLVAFDKETPYFYQLISRNETDDSVQLVYQAHNTYAAITKTFVIYKATTKIDMTLAIAPKNSHEVQARVMFPVPILPELGKNDVKSGLMTDQKGNVVKINRSKLEQNTWWYKPTFFGVEDRYFVFALIADTNDFTQRGYFRLAGHDEIYSILEGQNLTQEGTWTLSFYLGPKESSAMSAVDPRLENTLEYAGWRAPISKILLAILIALYKFFGNYGIAIIILTIAIRLFLLPFTWRSEQTMKERAEFQKKLQYIQQRYSQDPERLAHERSELISKNGMPGGIAGCLPLLVQIPIFFALSSVLSSAIQLYQAPFLWIPDLSARDPYYIVPLCVFITMVLQALSADQKNRVTMLLVAVMFGALSAGFASGLAIYIAVSTLLMVLQSLLYRKIKAA